jgi:hypothetical protein
MSLEDRIRSSVERALNELVKELAAAAGEQRDAAIAETERRVREAMEHTAALAREELREHLTREVRRELEAGFEARVAEALAAKQTEMQLALANAETRADQERQASVTAARVGERESELAGVSRFLESIRGLDGATSLSEVLDALALAASREAARAAVVVLRADRVQGWKLIGFGPRDAHPKSVDLPLPDAGVIGVAVGAARAVTTRESPTAAAGPGFEHLPADRMGLAVPVIVGGRVVAVVYADGVTLDGHARQTPSGWPELVEVLTRHAGRCLEALTAQKASAPARIKTGGVAAQRGPEGSEGTPARAPAAEPATGEAAAQAEPDEAARRTARLLVSEIRLYHEPVVHQGRRARNLLALLGPEIAKARQAYNAQVPVDVRRRTDYFYQELVTVLAGGNPELLGTT